MAAAAVDAGVLISSVGGFWNAGISVGSDQDNPFFESFYSSEIDTRFDQITVFYGSRRTASATKL